MSANLEVKKCVTYTYQTTDGREFDNKAEAMEWQKHLCNVEDLCLLDSEYEPTRDLCSAIYVYAKTKEQADSFNAIQQYFGYALTLPSTGFFRYDDVSDSYIDVENEIGNLQYTIDKLKKVSGQDVN